MVQSVSDPALLSCLLFLLQGIDQFDRGEEPYSLPMVLDGLHGYRGLPDGFLPVPGPPTSTTFWASSRNWRRCKDFIRASSTVLCLKSKPVRSR